MCLNFDTEINTFFICIPWSLVFFPKLDQPKTPNRAFSRVLSWFSWKIFTFLPLKVLLCAMFANIHEMKHYFPWNRPLSQQKLPKTFPKMKGWSYITQSRSEEQMVSFLERGFVVCMWKHFPIDQQTLVKGEVRLLSFPICL